VGRPLSVKFSLAYLVIAAAAKNNDYSKDYNPGAVIVKEMAEAVVIHSMFLRGCYCAASRRLFTYYVTADFVLQTGFIL